MRHVASGCHIGLQRCKTFRLPTRVLLGSAALYTVSEVEKQLLEFEDFKQKMKQKDLLVKTEYLNYPLQVIFQALQEIQSCMGIF